MTAGARSRPRLAFAVPLPKGAVAEADLVELYLSLRLPLATVRRLVEAGLPEGFRLLALEDEWIGEPSLASRVVATEYRAEVAGPRPLGRGDLEAVIARSAGGGRAAIVEWDAPAGRGTLRLRVEREASGRIVRPEALLAGFGLDLRVERLSRTAIELRADGDNDTITTGGFDRVR